MKLSPKGARLGMNLVLEGEQLPLLLLLLPLVSSAESFCSAST